MIRLPPDCVRGRSRRRMLLVLAAMKQALWGFPLSTAEVGAAVQYAIATVGSGRAS